MLYAVCGGGTMPRTEGRQILTDLLDKAKADAQGGEVTFAVLIEHRPDYSEAHATVVEWCKENGVPCDVWVEGAVTNPIYNAADGLYDDRPWVDLVKAFAEVDSTEVLALFVDPYEQVAEDDTLYGWLNSCLASGVVCRAFNAQMFELEQDDADTEVAVAPEEADLAAAQEAVEEVINNGPVFGADPDVEQLAQRLADIPEAPAPSYIEKFSAGELSEDDLRQLGAQDLRELCKAVGAEPENWRAKDAMVAALTALWAVPGDEVEAPALSPVLEASAEVSTEQDLRDAEEERIVAEAAAAAAQAVLPVVTDEGVTVTTTESLEGGKSVVATTGVPNGYEALERSLTNQPPTPQAMVYVIEFLRESAKALGLAILDAVPPSRERSLAITHLEETVMWAVKALVLHQDLGG